MKYAAALILIIGLASYARSASTYNNKYDGIDLDGLIKNERLFKGYYNCLIDVGPCQPDAQELKNYLPDALVTECQKCTDAQKEGSRKIIRYLIKNKSDWWKELEAKYDPKKVYITKYSEELKKEGIVL